MSTEETNPFAPTPLGKDWTPPTRPASRHDENAVGAPVEEGAVPLDDLFDAGSSSEEVASSLDDLFDAPEQATAPVEGGLDDLFPGEASSTGGTAVTGTTGASAARRRVRRRGVPAALRTKKRVIATDDDNPAGDDPAGDVPARGVPARGDQAGDVTPVTDREQVTTVGNVDPVPPVPSPVREPVEPVATVKPRPASPVPVTPRSETQEQVRGRSLFAQGPAEIERVWRVVDQTLGIVAADMSLQHITSRIVLTSDPAEYAAQRSEIHAALRNKMASAGIAATGLVDIETLLDLVVDEMSGISVLGELFRDPSVDEILVDRWDIISVERHGHLERTPIRFRDPRHAESCARVLALKVSDRAVSRAIPLVTAELPSARVTFAFGAVVKGGLSITIRKFRPLLGLEDLLRYGSLDEAMVAFLSDAVRARAGILVSGGTGTGKTTIVNLLSSFIPDTERVVSIEDAFELKLANTHVVSLQTKEASSLDDTVSVSLSELLRNTLRMRPDRIIVGEIREGAGAMVMLSAASTGHDGTLTTVHANSADGAVNERLPDLIRQSRGGLETETILRSIINAFDLVIHVTRTRDGRRYLSEVSALCGIVDGRIELQPVFSGTETSEGIRFERYPLGSDTELHRRLADRKEA